MTLNHGVEDVVYDWISKDQVEDVIKYIEDNMTATWFKEDGLIGAQKNSRQIITAEIIYYWMISIEYSGRISEVAFKSITYTYKSG